MSDLPSCVRRGMLVEMPKPPAEFFESHSVDTLEWENEDLWQWNRALIKPFSSAHVHLLWHGLRPRHGLEMQSI